MTEIEVVTLEMILLKRTHILMHAEQNSSRYFKKYLPQERLRSMKEQTPKQRMVSSKLFVQKKSVGISVEQLQTVYWRK